MTEAQKTEKVPPIRILEDKIFDQLKRDGYKAGEALEVIATANRANAERLSHKGKPTNIDTGSVFGRNIRTDDVNKVAIVLADFKSHPTETLLDFKFKGPIKPVTSEKDAGPLAGYSCEVQIGVHSYVVQLNPSNAASPLILGKTEGRKEALPDTPGTTLRITHPSEIRKEQLSDLLKNADSIGQVTEIRPTGAALEVSKADFIKNYQDNFSENPEAVTVKKPRRI